MCLHCMQLLRLQLLALSAEMLCMQLVMASAPVLQFFHLHCQAKLVEEGARSHAEANEEYYHAERDYTRAQYTVEEIEVWHFLYHHSVWEWLRATCSILFMIPCNQGYVLVLMTVLVKPHSHALRSGPCVRNHQVHTDHASPCRPRSATWAWRTSSGA